MKIKEDVSLKLLEDFYKEVWCKFDPYVENDKILYEIFKKDHNNNKLVLEARIGALATTYSASVDNFRDMIYAINKCGIDNPNYETIIKEYKDKSEENYNLVSFVSKYCHWYNEVNGRNPTPIYDDNVRCALKCGKTYDEIEESVKKFIIEKVKTELDKRIDIRIESLHETFSVYRLIDKFLWLSKKAVDLSEKREKGLKKNEKKLREIVKNEETKSKYFDS